VGIGESIKNGISMSRQIRFWFDNARLALKPLRQTEDGIVVQWHWLKRVIMKPKVSIRLDQDILLQAGLTDQSWGDCLAHRKSGVPIQTGQTFIIRADNPDNLPSWDLLELQWNMLRVAAICGAADVTDDYYDLDEEDSVEDEVVFYRQNAILDELNRSNEDAPSKGKEVDRRDKQGKQADSDGEW
jgi:hypothetical protein